jgi:hypothetical protein
MRDDDGYIGDASRSDRTDSYLGDPDTIYHGQNDEFTQKLDAQRIAALTPAQRLKMGAVAGPEPESEGVQQERERQHSIREQKSVFERGRLERRWEVISVGLAFLMALLAFGLYMYFSGDHKNPSGNSQEIPVKSPIPAPSPAPTTP